MNSARILDRRSAVTGRRSRAFLLTVATCAASLAIGAPPVAHADEMRTATGPSGTEYSFWYTCSSLSAGYTVDSTSGDSTGVTYRAEVNSAAGNVQFGGTRPFEIAPNRRIAIPMSLQNNAQGAGPHDNAAMFEISASGVETELFSFDIDCPDYNTFDRSYFSAVAPERILDTRPNQAVNSDGVKPSAGASVTIPRSSFPAIPDGTIAVSVTVTGTASQGRGFVQALPTGGAELGSSSTLNFAGPNETVANAGFVPLGADGSITLFTNVAAHLLVDVNGYFVGVEEGTGDASGGRLETTEPLRIYDTRAGQQVNHTGPAVRAGGVARIDLTSESSGLPAGASAAVVNITAVRSPAPGFVQAAPGGTLVPGDSSVLNVFDPSENIAGMAVVPLASDGSIDLLTSNGADIIVDLLGWFSAEGDDSDSGLFVPLPPQRVYDTRFASLQNAVGVRDGFIDIDDGYTEGTAGSVGTFGFTQSTGSLTAVMSNLTVTRALGPGFFEVRPLIRRGEGGETSSLNLPRAGATKANAVIAETTDSGDSFSIYASRGGQVIVDITGFFT